MNLICPRRRNSFLLWLLLMGMSGLQRANAQLNPFQLAGKQFMTRNSRLNYIAPLQTLLANKKQFGRESEDGPYAQALSTFYSFVGKINSAPLPRTSPAYRLVPVEPLLLPCAQATSVVILNEAHDQPAHRVYCRRLLAQLAPLGYRYFAVEALDPQATGLNERKFPLATSGFYTCEPNMGNLLRAATENGFTVFSHEVTQSQHKDFADGRRDSNYRDSMQAVNILAVLWAHPQAKLVALVGYGHVMEQERDGLKRLATYLRELGRIDPLTIDQTQAYPSAKTAQPLVLASGDGQPVAMGNYWKTVDLQIIHPPVAWTNGRPNWLAANKAITAAIPFPYLGHVSLVQLYDQTEYQKYGEKAVPLDQYLTTATQQRVFLFPYKSKRRTLIKYRSAELLGRKQ